MSRLMTTLALLASAPAALAAPFIDSDTRQPHPGSHAELTAAGYRLALPSIEPGTYRLCAPVGESGIDLGTLETDAQGDLRAAGLFPPADHPLQLFIHPSAGDCDTAPAYFTAAH